MENKNSMSRVERLHREKVTRYSIRKYSFGAASVAVAALFMFLGNGAVSADMTAVQPQDESGLKAERPDENAELPQVEKEVAQPAESTPAAQPIAEEPTAKPAEPVTPALDKKQLESYIKEIEAKLANGSYANKTDESVAVLKADLEAAKTTLVNATSQGELTKAYNKLVTTANTKLKNKPVEKKETPAVDTTNGKETVGKQVENTEKKSDSNSIENTGSNDPRNGKAMDKENAFRTEATAKTHEATTNKVGNISYTMEFSDDATKEIYLYNQEDTNIDITISSTAGNITKAVVRGGGNRALDEATKDSTDQIDGFGWSYKQTVTETPGPVTMNITGKTNERFLGLTPTNRREDQNSVLGERYLVISDAAGGSVSAPSNGSNQPGFFKLVVKSQTYKYDIKDLTDSTRITVNDINNVTDAELTTIKSRLQLEHSKTSNDARFVGGTDVSNPASLIDTVAVSTTDPTKLVVTYIDGSTDTIEKNKVLNVRPKGIIPFSNPATKEIYVYKGEETNIELSATDDSGKIKDIRIAEGGRGNNAPGAAGGKIRNQYGLTTGYQRNEAGIEATETNPAKVTITGTVSVSGQPNFTGNLMTRYLVAEDLEGATFSDPNGNSDSGKTVDQVPEGWFKLVVREQTQKFDIQGQTEENNKIAVSDVNNLSDADFEKIKNNIKIQYNTADDARLSGKNGTLVENASQYIKSITKEGDKIVVTYKDGSTDKLTLTDVVTLDKQPAIDAVNTAATEKIAAINSTPNATDEEKAAAVAKVNADKEKALTAINDANVTTKTALDAAQKAGTDAIAADNPVVAKKDAAKADVEAARKAKEDAIKANPNLSEDEKTAAIAKVNKAAEDAKKAIDAATSNADVETAKNTGISEFGKVNPVAKAAAKKAIADELSAKNTEIDGRQDLSQAEKDAAKAEAKKLADAQLDEIAKQPDNAETADAATAAQTAVNNAGTKGVADVKAVNPLGKTAAKADIETARQNKVDEITNNSNLSQEEKDAAIAKVNKAAEDAAKAIDAAQTADELTTAKGTGTTAIDNVTPVAKTAAKKAIADALTAKNAELDKRTDLTDEEKTAAKAEAQKLADAQLAEIAKQPDAADTKEAAKTAQDAVNAAGTKGAADVAAVNPAAKAKESAKADVEAARKAKEDAIKKDPNLSDKEKDAAIAKVNKAAEDAKKAIDAATSNADVETAKGTATTELGKVNPIAKENAKAAIANALTAKNAELDKRTDLTTEEKDAAKAEAKKLADAELAKIDAQPDNADTPEAAATAQKIVDDAEDKGVADVTAVNPEAKSKPAAKKAIEDKLAKQLEDIANTPDATDDEKKVAADAAKALADEAKEEIDKAGTDAEVKQLQKEAEGEIEKSVPVVEDKPNARKAIEDEAKAKKAAIDARNDLTPKAKEALKAKVDKVAEKAKAAIDAVTSVEDVNTIEEADKAAIKAIGDINRPIDKVLVKDPSALTDEEKAKILEEVKKVNPTATEVKYNDNGDIEVTTENGNKGTIKPAKLVKTEGDLDNGKGGNNIHKPLDKVIVKDPSALTDEEKAKIVAKVEEVNPDAIVTIDENGTVSVSTPDGKTAAIPASDLVRTKEDTAKAGAGNSNIVKPADKVVGEANDPDDQAKAEEKLRELNPETKSVKFDENGNATVTLNDGTTATIPSEDLFRSAADATKPNAGNDIVKPADKTAVKDPANLTPEEKKAIEDKVKAVNPDATVVVDDKGNATVTTPEGKTAVIPATDLTKDPEAATKPNAGNDIVKPADKTAVKDPANLTPEEKKAIEDKVKAVNPGSTVVVDDKGNATVTTPEGKTAVIPASDLTKSAADAAKPNAGNDIVKPADKTVVANPDALTPEEKKAIEDKVKAVNPGATVVVDDKGNATVTTPEGKTAVIPATDLVKTQDDITKENAGNDVNTPAAKTVVANPDKLTDAEKKAIEDKVKAVNPGSTVVVDDKGNATVAKGDGTVLNIPVLDLVIPADDLVDAAKNTAVKTPAIRTLVADKEKLTDAEKAAVKKAIEAVNPGATVVVDDKGNATVTLDGNTVSIAKDQLVKTASDVTDKNSGDNINLDFEKETVADLNNLTDAEKEAAKAKIKGANADVVEVIFDKAGNATVVTKDGKVLAIAAEDIFKQRPSAPNSGGNGTSGNNGTTNTDVKVDKAKLEGAIRQLDELIIKESAKLDAETVKEANDLLADAKKLFANADASQAEVDAMVKRIEDFMAKVAPSTDHATPANDQAAQTPAVAPATAQAANANQEATNTRTVAKELPNTGTADSVAFMVAAAASAVLGLGLAGRRRKEDEEA